MSEPWELVARIQASGIRLTLSPQGKLRVSPPGALSPEVLSEIKIHREGVLDILRGQQSGIRWPCRYCGQPAEIEAVEPSLDGHRMLTFWCCKSCHTWGVTAGTIQQSPVWVRSKLQ
jgi:hypothetical protein